VSCCNSGCVAEPHHFDVCHLKNFCGYTTLALYLISLFYIVQIFEKNYCIICGFKNKYDVASAPTPLLKEKVSPWGKSYVRYFESKFCGNLVHGFASTTNILDPNIFFICGVPVFFFT
jgi:hypothetical protein